jgi:hypothetical protein
VLTSGSMTFVTFGERVLKACVLRGMTLGDLEREAKLSRGYASRISRDERGGKRPSRWRRSLPLFAWIRIGWPTRKGQPRPQKRSSKRPTATPIERRPPASLETVVSMLKRSRAFCRIATMATIYPCSSGSTGSSVGTTFYVETFRAPK